jgi:hypothetical protein
LWTVHGYDLTEVADDTRIPRGHAPVIAKLRCGHCAGIPGKLPADGPDASWLLRKPLRGHSPELREMFPGNYSDSERLLPGECPDDSSDLARIESRTRRKMLR